jgi:hypothetical protein
VGFFAFKLIFSHYNSSMKGNGRKGTDAPRRPGQTFCRTAVGRSPVQTGAHKQDRTADLILTKDVLYLLSYVGFSCNINWLSYPPGLLG